MWDCSNVGGFNWWMLDQRGKIRSNFFLPRPHKSFSLFTPIPPSTDLHIVLQFSVYLQKFSILWIKTILPQLHSEFCLTKMRTITIVIIKCDLKQSNVQRTICTGQILTLSLKQCYLFRCQRWKQNMHREDLLHKSPKKMKHFRIWGEHFEPSQFKNPNAEWVYYFKYFLQLLPIIPFININIR